MNKNKRIKFLNYDLKFNGGFTLIELLLVIAIIGILAAAVLVSVSGQREKARAARAMESIRSAMPYMVECYMKGGNVDPTPVVNQSVCDIGSMTGITFPSLGDSCSYNGSASSSTQTVANCEGYYITCRFEGNGNCEMEKE